MRKLFPYFAVLCLVWFLTGCGHRSPEAVESTDNTNASVPIPAERDTASDFIPPVPVDFDCIPLQGGSKSVSWTAVPLDGDYNLDGEVSGRDLFQVTAHFGETEDGEFFTQADGNSDGSIDELDVPPIASNFYSSIAGWRLYRSLFSDGREGVAEGELIPWDPESVGAMQIMHQQEDFAPAYYCLTTVAGDKETESEPTPVRPREKLIAANTEYGNLMIVSADGEEFWEFDDLDDKWTAYKTPWYHFSTDRSTILLELTRGGTVDEISLWTLAQAPQGGWEFHLVIQEDDLPEHLNFRWLKISGVSGHGTKASFVVDSGVSGAYDFGVYETDLATGEYERKRTLWHGPYDWGIPRFMRSSSDMQRHVYLYATGDEEIGYRYFIDVLDGDYQLEKTIEFSDGVPDFLVDVHQELYPSLSGNGKTLLFAVFPDREFDYLESAMYTLDIDAETYYRSEITTSINQNLGLSWDGSRGVCVGNSDLEEGSWVYSFTSDFQEVYPIVPESSMQVRLPDISMDGMYVSFLVLGSGMEFRTFVSSFDGSQDTYVIDWDYYLFPKFQ